jgi:hypothetical protein
MPNRDQLSTAVARELRAASATQRRRRGAPVPAPGRQPHAGGMPGRWLYPLATASRLRRMLRSKAARDDCWWPIASSFPWIRSGDFVYFYTTEGDAGIIGFAKVDATDAQSPDGPRAKLSVDMAVSTALMATRPLPASTMAQWLHPPRGAVEDLRAAAHDVDGTLASVPAYARHLRTLRRNR